MIGGTGQDALSGGAGADAFVFDAINATGHDHIVDFLHGVDRLNFTGADYGFAAGHRLTSAEFTVGAQALGSAAQFVWDPTVHMLYWDLDGAGGTAAIEFALIDGLAVVVASDLYFM